MRMPTAIAMLLLLVPNVHAVLIQTWETDRGRPTNGTTAVLHLAPKSSGASCWGTFPDIVLTNGGSITLNCQLRFDTPPRDPSASQLRVALHGAPAGATNRLQALRGFILNGGIARGQWETMLWERPGPANLPCIMSNSVTVGSTREPAGPTPDLAMRLVFTIRRTAPRTYDISGFWGSHAFTFLSIATTADHILFNSVGFLNGASSGITNLAIDNCRVTSP